MQIASQPSPTQAGRCGAVLIKLPRLYEAALIDISLRAALLEPNERFEGGVGEPMRLRVLTERGNQACEVQAVIAYRSELGIGLAIDVSERNAMRSLYRQTGGYFALTDRLAERSLAELVEAYLGMTARGVSATTRPVCADALASAPALPSREPYPIRSNMAAMP